MGLCPEISDVPERAARLTEGGGKTDVGGRRLAKFYQQRLPASVNVRAAKRKLAAARVGSLPRRWR